MYRFHGLAKYLIQFLKHLNKLNYSINLKMRRKVISLFIILITINFGVQAQSFINLSEMEVSLGQQTYSAPVVNKSASGEELSIAGVNFVLKS